MSPDPAAWGGNLLPNHREPDDDLHTPDPRRDRKSDQGGTICTARGISNLGCLAILFAGITMLLYVFEIWLWRSGCLISSTVQVIPFYLIS